ncbi:SigE family RNA polymerase sigma factor [Nocardioides yefusunii]|uniref:SigE family RNA polymerase sigma factor n=1 Tax=Nocardioides yefusunii TaxID=2500546 RepID=A0ABW1R3S1_9ACTN|nr:SigE family RNA polymerase sigma factor [Nocardioides yefusunii]
MSRDEEFTDFLTVRWSRLVRQAQLMGCTHADAEDVVQTTFTQAYVHWRKVSRADNPDAYLHRMLVNAFLASRRGQKGREQASDEVPDGVVADRTGNVDTTDALLRALGRLGTDQRLAVVLRHYAHLGEHEMAQVLGVAPGTVKSRLARAMKALASDPGLLALEGQA